MNAKLQLQGLPETAHFQFLWNFECWNGITNNNDINPIVFLFSAENLSRVKVEQSKVIKSGQKPPLISVSFKRTVFLYVLHRYVYSLVSVVFLVPAHFRLCFLDWVVSSRVKYSVFSPEQLQQVQLKCARKYLMPCEARLKETQFVHCWILVCDMTLLFETMTFKQKYRRMHVAWRWWEMVVVGSFCDCVDLCHHQCDVIC